MPGSLGAGYIQGAAQVTFASGSIASGEIPPQAIISGMVASGALTGQAGGGYFALASGTVGTFDIGSGAIQSGRIASGQIGVVHLQSGLVTSGLYLSGSIGSGQLGRYHLASGCVIDIFFCEELISGLRAVAWGSGGCFIVAAQRHSGLRMPAIGVTAGNYVSGAAVPVVRRGVVGITASGAIASGFVGQWLYVGSGGLLINQSGYMGGVSSGNGAAPTAAASGGSGYLVQRIGICVSGGIDVMPDSNVTSGLISGLLSAY